MSKQTDEMAEVIQRQQLRISKLENALSGLASDAYEMSFRPTNDLRKSVQCHCEYAFNVLGGEQ